MNKKLLFRLVALVAAMMCALGVSAAEVEAYACYTPSNTTLTFYYDNLRSTRTGTTYDLNTGSSSPGWYSDGTNSSVTQVVFDSSFSNARPTTAYRWFSGMTNLQSFAGMQYLNTSNVTNMYSMFNKCSSLTSLDLSHFNTSNVTNMVYMFSTCRGLSTLDLSHINTAIVTNMIGMFESCSGLTSLDLSSFNTANVTSMYRMFRYCTNLTSLNLSSFNTAKVTDMCCIFSDCSRLTSLDLSSFNTAKVKDMSFMFNYCSCLTTIYAGDEWSTAAVTSSSDMFYYCTMIRGGAGTTYNSSHVEKEYAHIDGGPSNPGYFTAKFVRGDVNGDGNVGMDVLSKLINYLLTGDPTGVSIPGADADQSGTVGMDDLSKLISYLLTNQW